MLDAFASVGAERFDLTFTDAAGNNVGYRINRTLDQLRSAIPQAIACEVVILTFSVACWRDERKRQRVASGIRLLVRRSLGQEPEVKYHRSNAPAEVPLEKLAQVRGGHWSVEQSFEAAKGECGLDEYETRGWVGWHHHTALSLLGLWFLGLQRRRLGEKRAADDRARGAGPAGASPRRAAVG